MCLITLQVGELGTIIQKSSASQSKFLIISAYYLINSVIRIKKFCSISLIWFQIYWAVYTNP
jgi:hypothetical protein